MIDVIFENLSARQEAYRKVCERFYIEIGNYYSTSGEDTAAYFTVMGENEDGEPVQCLPEQPVCKYAVITSHDDYFYVYADDNTLADAKEHAQRHIDDDIFTEQPVRIINLDTGKEYVPELSAKWSAV